MLMIRQNIATREWVIISTERAKRPAEFVQEHSRMHEQRPAHDDHCPFCPGNEEPELERLRIPAEGAWLTRVVRNKFPALRETGVREQYAEGIHHAISGVGYHEVVVASPLHNISPAQELTSDIARTLTAFQMRARAIREDARIEQITFFRNHGPGAGMSLAHPHAQLLALPVVPYTIRGRTEQYARYFDDHGVCPICQMCVYEERDQVRIVAQSEHFAAFVLYAAFSPFHLWIVPRRHHASFVETTPAEIEDLSRVLRTVVRKVYFGLRNPDFNYVIRQAPEREQQPRYMHWHMSVIPRVTQTAGFELGAGMYINPTLPEASAAFLRSVTDPERSASTAGDEP